MTVILGLNAYHAGAAAALVVDGKVVAAVAEERLNRVKYYAGFPDLAVREVLRMGGVGVKDVRHVAIGRDPSRNRMQKIGYALRNPGLLPNLLAIQQKGNRRLSAKSELARVFGIDEQNLNLQIHPVEHHIAHLASSYYTSSWDSCAGFTMDGSGDFVSTMFARCEGNRIIPLKKIFVPHSAGSLYTMISEFIGYDSYGDEGKVMGLAPYGHRNDVPSLDKLVRLEPDGFSLDLSYFSTFGSNDGMKIDEGGKITVSRHYSDRMVKEFGPARKPDGKLEQRDIDLAAAVQGVFEKIFMHCLHVLHKQVPSTRIAIAGGCALNSVANGKIFEQTPFRETAIHAAAGDDGLSVGAALYTAHSILGGASRTAQHLAYLGPEYSDEEIEKALVEQKVPFRKLSREELINTVADRIVAGKVIGWFQGKMEWGPRALGNRSILVHPGFPGMKDILNARIKRREWYRPFAPVILENRQSEVFEGDFPSPYMLHVYQIRQEWRDRLSAVTHVDGSGRIQTVRRDENPMYFDLISAFEKRTGIPVLLNTSFNENEPIVCRPDEAIACYSRTKMDVLAIGSYFCAKEEAPPAAL